MDKIKFSIRYSDKGYDFNGNKLNEDNLYSGTQVLWKGNFYTTGNRKDDDVELFTGRLFDRTVKMKKIRLIKVIINSNG